MYNKPFVISKKRWETYIKYYTWKAVKYSLLQEIDEKQEQIFVVPFSQAKERWFKVKWDEKIRSILIEDKKFFNFDDFISTFEEKESILDGELKEYFDEKTYKEIVKNIVEKEIWNGEWSNFLVAQKVEWKIKKFDIEVALSIFKRLLEWDYGTYLHFIFYDGEKIFIWASPERNVSVSKDNTVRMNPISWTFKKVWYNNYLDFKNDFLQFLQDEKEINELFMATDEELKMMSKICSSGGMIVWPILKEMANLIHTEYLLSGKTNLSKIEVLRQSMWASTVIWSPIESAFRVVSKYEDFSRKYYAWAICHIYDDELDSAIMIRTLQLDTNWNLEIYVGASLVKGSNPQKEYEELQIKLKWVLNAIAWKKANTLRFLPIYYLDDNVQELLQNRNQDLSKTWFFRQNDDFIKNEILDNKKVLIINNEDDFTNMIAHLLKLLWLNVVIKKYFEVELKKLDNYDFVLIWPWPWNPTENNSKMLKNLEIIDFLEKNKIKYFWICLWHQLICRYKNIKLEKQKIATQWEQIEIDFFWEKEKVAFYNTFVAVDNWNLEWLELSKSKDNKIYALRWNNFFSLQFHPESILTKYGLSILENELEILFEKEIDNEENIVTKNYMKQVFLKAIEKGVIWEKEMNEVLELYDDMTNKQKLDVIWILKNGIKNMTILKLRLLNDENESLD